MTEPKAILVTNCDSSRPGLVYKIDFESDQQMKEWLDFKFFQEEKSRQWVSTSPTEGLTTSVTLLYSTGEMEVRLLRAEFTDITAILWVADDLTRVESRAGSGRPPKRVLQATTSKERRDSKMRAGY